MKMKVGLAVLAMIALGLGGCATGSKTDAPAGQASGAQGKGGAGGTGADTSAAPKKDAPKAEAVKTEADKLPGEWRVHFAFDSTALDEENRKVVEAHGRYLAANPNVKVQLEGHADERGTREYNLALGERRAQAVEKLLRVLGVTGKRVTVTSYGEEKPIAPEHNEEGWAMNRRVEIIYQ